MTDPRTKSDIRPGEATVGRPAAQTDAGVYFIGRIRTPWTDAQGLPEERPRGPRDRGGLHRRGRSALGGGAGRGRDLLAPDPALLDGPGAPRSRGAGAGPLRRRPRHLCAALAGAAEPDRAQRGASCVKVEGTRLESIGLDCLDGTPLLDIKPYFASTDSIPDAQVGWHATGSGPPQQARTKQTIQNAVNRALNRPSPAADQWSDQRGKP